MLYEPFYELGSGEYTEFDEAEFALTVDLPLPLGPITLSIFEYMSVFKLKNLRSHDNDLLGFSGGWFLRRHGKGRDG